MKSEEEIKNMSLLEYILFIDWMSTKDFCDWQGCPHPIAVGTPSQMADQFLQVDAIKHRLFVQKAKEESRKPKTELPDQPQKDIMSVIKFAKTIDMKVLDEIEAESDVAGIFDLSGTSFKISECIQALKEFCKKVKGI